MKQLTNHENYYLSFEPNFRSPIYRYVLLIVHALISERDIEMHTYIPEFAQVDKLRNALNVHFCVFLDDTHGILTDIKSKIQVHLNVSQFYNT